HYGDGNKTCQASGSSGSALYRVQRLDRLTPGLADHEYKAGRATFDRKIRTYCRPSQLVISVSSFHDIEGPGQFCPAWPEQTLPLTGLWRLGDCSTLLQ